MNFRHIGCGLFTVLTTTLAQGDTGNFTLDGGLSYELYKSLNVVEVPVQGGTAKSVVSRDVRLDCYHAPRYSCVLTAPRRTLFRTQDGAQFARIADAGFSSRMFAAMGNAGAETSYVQSDGFSFLCNRGYCDVMVQHSTVTQPIEREPRYPGTYPDNGANCEVTLENCTFAGYCWYTYLGRTTYEYKTNCPGTRQVQRCVTGTFRTQCGYN